jgi:hypothetical protein
MSHIHWVSRQNKLEVPRDKDEQKRTPPQGTVLFIMNQERER